MTLPIWVGSTSRPSIEVPAKWEIEEYRGTFDVRRDGRAFKYDLDDIEDAVRAIRRSRKFQAGDQIIVIEESGYRHRLRVS